MALPPPPPPSSSPAQTTPSDSALKRTQKNLAYLYDPSKSPAPASRRTRAFLKSARYTLKFLFWRLVRYAKYAAIGSLTALLAGGVFGTVVSGAGFVIAPTGILGGATVGVLWAVGKFGWKRLAKKARGGTGTGDARLDEKMDAEGETIRKVQEKREEKGLRADPW